MDYLAEAFQRLDAINEGAFSVDKGEMEDLADFEDVKAAEPEIAEIVDGTAKDENELADTYVGKVILDCKQCHSKIYKDREDVHIDETTELVNGDDECPYCFGTEGYEIVGEVVPFEDRKEHEKAVADDETELKENIANARRIAKRIACKRNFKVTEAIRPNKLIEAPICDLEPRYDGRKSFYGKAKVNTGDNDDQNSLYSYNTLVAKINDEGKPEVYGTFSDTTLRHIKEWLRQHGFKAESKAQIMKDYYVYNSALEAEEAGKLRHYLKNLPEAMKRRNRLKRDTLKEGKVIDESIEDVEVKTDKETIKVSAEDKADKTKEKIVPVADETKRAIAKENGEEFEDIDEDTFDKLGEAYLTKVYGNVKGYKTSSITATADNKLIVEGVISFKSGNKKKTQFVFESVAIRGKSCLVGENKQITRGKKAFRVGGKIENGKFITESFRYNYSAMNPKTGKSECLYETLRGDRL